MEFKKSVNNVSTRHARRQRVFNVERCGNKSIGFRPQAVFKVEDTDGKSLDYQNIEIPKFRFLEVAKEWGLKVAGIGFVSNYYGAYSSSEKKILMASPEEED